MNISKSSRLRRYRSVYNEYVNKLSDTKSKSSSRKSVETIIKNTQYKTYDPLLIKEIKVDVKRRSRIKQEVAEKADKKKIKKPLSDYQKFIARESKKEKYAKLKPTDRMKKISEAWKKQKSKK